jgi:hypothetical protein
MSVTRLWKARKFFIPVTAILAVLVSSVIWVSTSKATSGSGVTVQLIAAGNLSAPVRVKVKDDSKTNMDISEVQTYKITIPPGAYTGWHKHGGPHIIVVAAGTLTYYMGHDPTCTGVKYSAGSSILDAGFMTHFVRNEGTVDVVTYVTQLLPAGGVFRIDVPAPGNCGF